MDIQTEIQRLGQIATLPAGALLFKSGDGCDNYVLVNKGQVRVELASITGQQLLLYRIDAGQPCVLTTACLMSGDNYSAQAIAETEVEIVLIAKAVFSTKLAESSDFRGFVFNGFSERLSVMMQRTSELATYSIDQRLAAALLARYEWNNNPVLDVTHGELAVEIGSAREVVSRRLATFEADGFVRKHRNTIEILDISGLNSHLAQW